MPIVFRDNSFDLRDCLFHIGDELFIAIVWFFMFLLLMNYRKSIGTLPIEFNLPSFFTNYLLSEPFSIIKIIFIAKIVGTSVSSKVMINFLLIYKKKLCI